MAAPILAFTRPPVRSTMPPRNRPRAQLYRLLLLIVVTMLFGSMGCDESGPSIPEDARWVSIGHDGPRFHSDRTEAGADPAALLTTQVREELATLRDGSLQPADPASRNWFDPNTGEAQLWYHKDGQTLTFYGLPAFHPGSGLRLEPVDPQVRKLWESSRDGQALAPGPSFSPEIPGSPTPSTPMPTFSPKPLPLPTYGFISLRSTPSGAQILGGSSRRPYGETPRTIRVKKGAWNFILHLEGYEDRVLTGRTEAGRTEKMLVDLKPLPAPPAYIPPSPPSTSPPAVAPNPPQVPPPVESPKPSQGSGPAANPSSPGTASTTPFPVFDLTTPAEMELAADDLVYLAKLLKDRAKAGSKQSKAATDTLISDADVFIKVAELYKSEFETYRTDPARYRKLVEGLSRFRSLFAQRREVSGLDREVTRVLTHVDQLVSGIERRLEPMIRAGELEQVDEGR